MLPEEKIPLGVKLLNGLPYTVIIVDDSAMMRKLLNRILLSEKFEVIDEAESGEKGIEAYITADKKPDFMFIDIEMPGLNGVDTVKELKKFNPDIQIVMCTSVTDQSVVKELVALGISGYIAKPFDRDAVIQRLAKILKRTDFIDKFI
jgi:two-component system chemotaxis response regulator CheY